MAQYSPEYRKLVAAARDHSQAGDVENTELAIRALIQSEEQRHGRDGPGLAEALMSAGSSYKRLGDLEGARLVWERALGLIDAAPGSTSDDHLQQLRRWIDREVDAIADAERRAARSQLPVAVSGLDVGIRLLEPVTAPKPQALKRY
jgi:hypothetical protein